PALPHRSAAHLSRELVSQGRRRQISVARLRRKFPRAQVDHRPHARPRAGTRNADRLDAALSRVRLDGARLSAEPVRAVHENRRRGVAARAHLTDRAFRAVARPAAEGTRLPARAAPLAAEVIAILTRTIALRSYR